MSRTLAQAVRDLTQLGDTLPARVEALSRRMTESQASVLKVDVSTAQMTAYLSDLTVTLTRDASSGDAQFAARVARFDAIRDSATQALSEGRQRFTTDFTSMEGLEDRHASLNAGFIEEIPRAAALVKKAGDDVAEKSQMYGSALRRNLSEFLKNADAARRAMEDLQRSSKARLDDGIKDLDAFSKAVEGFGGSCNDVLSNFDIGVRGLLSSFAEGVTNDTSMKLTAPIDDLANHARTYIDDNVKGGVDELVRDFIGRGLKAVTGAIGSAEEKSLELGRRMLEFPDKVAAAVRGIGNFVAQAAEILRALGKAFINRLDAMVDRFCEWVKDKFEVDLPDSFLFDWAEDAINSFIDGSVDGIRAVIHAQLEVLKGSIDIVTDIFLIQVHTSMGDFGKVAEDTSRLWDHLFGKVKDAIGDLIPSEIRDWVSI